MDHNDATTTKTTATSGHARSSPHLDFGGAEVVGVVAEARPPHAVQQQVRHARHAHRHLHRLKHRKHGGVPVRLHLYLGLRDATSPSLSLSPNRKRVRRGAFRLARREGVFAIGLSLSLSLALALSLSRCLSCSLSLSLSFALSLSLLEAHLRGAKLLGALELEVRPVEQPEDR
eukprot:363838-Prorocentrum_minimum.AAC.1